MFFMKKMFLGLKKIHFFAKKVIFLPYISIISNDYENLLKIYLAEIKYGINSGHQVQHHLAPFCCISLRAIEVVTEWWILC